MEPFEPEAIKKRRNTFLLILCILVFVDAGSSFLEMLLMPIYSNKETAEMALNIYKNMGDEVTKQMEQIFTAAQALPGWYFVISSLPFLLAIVGGVFVLRRKPLGFHLYVISQLLAFCCQNLLLKEPFQMSWISIICSVCIALCFYFQLKDNNKSPDANNEEVDN
jgi:hypothetical protein